MIYKVTYLLVSLTIGWSITLSDEETVGPGQHNQSHASSLSSEHEWVSTIHRSI
jgi:hypothetical protein